MKIEARVKPRAKTAAVKRQADGSFLIQVKAPAQDGKANEAVVQAVAEYFGVPKNAVTIVRGQTGRNKLINVKNPA